MAKKIRQIGGNNTQDPSGIAAIEYSKFSGSKKISEVGRHLIPIPYNNSGTIAYTTDASTARRLPNTGVNLAVYNNSGSLGSITLGSLVTAPTVLASGVTDANGNVGIPCAPNSWTYIACGDSNVWVIASASTLITFIINDETYIRQENP